VIQRLDYLLDLGVNAIYLNPIFHSTSNHRYNTTDYFRIDPRLGSLEDFNSLVDLVHRSGMRLILDGVFNHCGRGFFAFNDLLENEAHSPFKDWFHVKRFPLDAYGPGQAENYLAWWKFKSLPKLNTSNPQVSRYIMDVARYWTDQGIDGWRLDVPNEIDDDDFWAEFREVVKRANPQAYLVGEIWDGDPRWVGPAHFDGLLNYPLREYLLGYLATGSLTATAFADRVEALLARYPRENAFAHYLPLGSHDTERVRTLCAGKLSLVRLAFLFTFTHPGAPAVYYGDEVGLSGGKDPDSRRAFPWDESAWERGLREHVRQLARLRHRLPALRRGDLLRLLADDTTRVSAFGRRLGAEAAAVVLNPGDGSRSVDLPAGPLGWSEGQEVHQAFSDTTRRVRDGAIRLPLAARTGALLYTDPVST
jgi:glycosidase